MLRPTFVVISIDLPATLTVHSQLIFILLPYGLFVRLLSLHSRTKSSDSPNIPSANQVLRTKRIHVSSSGLLQSPSLLLRNLVRHGALSCSCQLESGRRFGHCRRLGRIQQPEESSLGLSPKLRRWLCEVGCTAS